MESEENNLMRYINQLAEGKSEEIILKLIELYPKTLDKNKKLMIVDAILSYADALKYKKELVDFASDGIKISQDLNLSDLQAYFMGRKANCLMTEILYLKRPLEILKISPREWIGFSTEKDKEQYEFLASKIKFYKKEIDSLIERALSLTKNKKTTARILMSKGQIESINYTNYKMDCFLIRGKTRNVLWNKFSFLHYPLLEYYLFFDRKQRKKLRHLFKSHLSNLLESAKMFEEINDPASGSVYYNIANNLGVDYRFRKANRFLNKAEVIARKNEDKFLLMKIEKMREVLKLKNKGITNHLNKEQDE